MEEDELHVSQFLDAPEVDRNMGDNNHLLG